MTSIPARLRIWTGCGERREAIRLEGSGGGGAAEGEVEVEERRGVEGEVGTRQKGR